MADWFDENNPGGDYTAPADNLGSADPYHDPTTYAGYDQYTDPNNFAQTTPVTSGGGYSTPPPDYNNTGAPQQGWSQAPDGKWYFADPSTTQVQNQPSYQAPSYQGSNGPSLPNLANFKSPDPLAPWTESFNAPTANDAVNSPGFQFRLDQGLKGLQRSAAAKGTLLTGGTLKGLNDYAQNSASQEYGNVYNRAYNEYDTRRQNFLTNEANRYNSQRSNLGDQWGINSDYFNMGKAQQLQDFNIFNTNRAFDYGVNTDTKNFNNMLDQQYWNNALSLATLGKPPAPNL